MVVVFAVGSYLSPCSENAISALLLPPIPAFSLFQDSVLKQSGEVWSGLLSFLIGGRAKAFVKSVVSVGDVKGKEKGEE